MMRSSLGTALSVALRPPVRPSRASEFLETGKPWILLGNMALEKSN